MSELYSPHHKLLRIIFLLVSFFVLIINASSQPTITFNSAVSTGLTLPIDMANAGDGTGRNYIVQQQGTIRVYDDAFNFLGNFLTVSDVSYVMNGERGLLSMAFDPDYATNGFFYVYYTNLGGDLELARYQVSGDPLTSNTADAGSKEILLTIEHSSQSNHNGGKLLFGDDGYLYFATGDGGGAGDPTNNAQNGNSLLGKMLRIDVTNTGTDPYLIPPSNPYVGVAGVLDEIWAMGLRNPFRWSFDSQTGDMWIGDVGQGDWEEINFTPASSTGGENYGWRCYEGNATENTSGCSAMSNYDFPTYVYPNPNPGQSAVTGGVVYRGNSYTSLQGYYMAADVYSGEIFLIDADNPGPADIQSGPTFIVSFAETEDGEVYAVSLSGTIYAVTVNEVLPVRLVNFSAQLQNDGKVELNWKTASEENVRDFELEYSTDGANYQKFGTVAATNRPAGSNYQFYHAISFNGKVAYRLKMTDIDGRSEYSNIVFVNITGITKNFVYPSIITNRTMSVFVNESFTTLEVINSSGAVLIRRNISGTTGKIDIQVNSIGSGVYIVQLKTDMSRVTQKIFIQ